MLYMPLVTEVVRKGNSPQKEEKATGENFKNQYLLNSLPLASYNAGVFLSLLYSNLSPFIVPRVLERRKREKN